MIIAAAKQKKRRHEKRKPGAGGESPMTEQFGYSELRKRSPKRGSRGRNT